MSETDELPRATRAQLQIQMDKAVQEAVKRELDRERLTQLERQYELLQRELLELDYHRAGLALRLSCREDAALDPVPYASFARRVSRVVFAACIGGIFAGMFAPVVTLLQDPVISKAFEGLIGGAAGALAAEKEDWANTRRENPSRNQERITRHFLSEPD
jgi:hypothetical protein